MANAQRVRVPVYEINGNLAAIIHSSEPVIFIAHLDPPLRPGQELTNAQKDALQPFIAFRIPDMQSLTTLENWLARMRLAMVERAAKQEKT